MRYKKTLMIFHRDLRLTDNTALYEALRLSDHVIPLFIFDPVQVGKINHYKGSHFLQFMVESLDDLAEHLHKQGGKLFFFHGHTQEIVKQLLKTEAVDAVFCNRDYTPFARERDQELEKLVKQHNRAWHLYDDALLTNPDEIFTGKGTPYTIYTAFLKKAATYEVASPARMPKGQFFKGHISREVTLASVKKGLYEQNVHAFVHGGSTVGKKLLHSLGLFKNYSATRDYPTAPTTGLSAHLKCGTVSIREAYYAIKEHKTDPTLIKQLYWRDFFTYLGYHFPYVFGKAFVEKYQHLEWSDNHAWFTRWCEGATGFPLVDAGMRQLNTTGYMHNRVRMVVASFLTKDLHIDWRKGERYFAQQLIDYDPCVNNGNWQWAASTGADAQPYFRIFNPWLQQKKFDPECVYIKQWIPELQNLPVKAIHNWYKATSSHNGYPLPVVDHAQESKKALMYFKKAAL